MMAFPKDKPRASHKDVSCQTGKCGSCLTTVISVCCLKLFLLKRDTLNNCDRFSLK